MFVFKHFKADSTRPTSPNADHCLSLAQCCLLVGIQSFFLFPLLHIDIKDTCFHRCSREICLCLQVTYCRARKMAAIEVTWRVSFPLRAYSCYASNFRTLSIECIWRLKIPWTSHPLSQFPRGLARISVGELFQSILMESNSLAGTRRVCWIEFHLHEAWKPFLCSSVTNNALSVYKLNVSYHWNLNWKQRDAGIEMIIFFPLGTSSLYVWEDVKFTQISKNDKQKL